MKIIVEIDINGALFHNSVVLRGDTEPTVVRSPFEEIRRIVDQLPSNGEVLDKGFSSEDIFPLYDSTGSPVGLWYVQEEYDDMEDNPEEDK